MIKARGPAPEKTPSPPRAGATTLRNNPPNTAFRRFYERGDLPISVDHKSFKNAIKWKVRAVAFDKALWGSEEAAQVVIWCLCPILSVSFLLDAPQHMV